MAHGTQTDPVGQLKFGMPFFEFIEFDLALGRDIVQDRDLKIGTILCQLRESSCPVLENACTMFALRVPTSTSK